MAQFRSASSGQQSGGQQAGFSGRGPMGAMNKAPKVENVKETLWRLGGYIQPWRHSLFIVFCLAVLATAITIIGTRLAGYTVDAYILPGDMRGLAFICLVQAGLYGARAISTYVQNHIMIRAAQGTAATIRRDLFGRMQRLPLHYFDAHSSGDLMSRLTNDVDNINAAMAQNVVQLFVSIITIVGMLIAMLLLSPLLTLICLLTTPLTYILSRILITFAQRFYVVQQRELGELNGYIEEMVSGQKVVRLFSREPEVQTGLDEINTRYAASSWRASSISGVVGPINNGINNLAYLLVAVGGGAAIITGFSAITVGMVFSFLLYMRNFTNPINNILNLVNSLQLALASAERVFTLMDEPEEHDSAEAVPVGPIHGDIDIHINSFSYVPDKEVLHHTNIIAKAGQTIAIVGPTGAGKTTIINLLTKFYDVEDGHIYIDGKDIRQLTRHSLRQAVAMVLQDTFLFSDTIRENIRYGRPLASDEEVEQAARQARAHDFIIQLPQGYDTVLVDNGENLSQGQRQLVGIARAIVSASSILILDEATSSIDTRTELLIQEALLELMKGKTSFVIAHRLSTIRNADLIVVMDKGQVVESGTHAELLAAHGLYADLHNSQFKGFAL